MPDPRVTRLAQVLVRYSLALRPGDEFCLLSTPLADELSLAVYKEAIEAGAHVSAVSQLAGSDELFFKHAGDDQLDHVPRLTRLVADEYDALLRIDAPVNTRALSGVDPARMSRAQKAQAGIWLRILERTAREEFRWCVTLYPTQASAQEADMSLSEYEDFVYGAGLLDRDDPVAAWQAIGERQQKLTAWLANRDQVVIKGSNVDLALSIEGRSFVDASGKVNFPDGEIYTSPVESSAQGWIRFSYPAIYAGREVIDVELWFEDGKVVREKAGKGQDLLTALLDTDAGSRYLGELGIGTNYGIQRFTKNMLFDEKMGGTIHLAVGACYPETGGKNESGVHWDMLCDMAEGEITVDGDLFFKDGQVAVEV
jgi:aminopeptidase